MHRHLDMLKSRTLLFTAVGLLLLGIVLFTCSSRDQGSVQTFPATINRDCAPWDGSAFTVFIPMRDGGVIDISIWQAPDIKFSRTFSFPDNTGQVGNVSYQPASGAYEPLSGTVFFQHVEAGSSVKGRFELTTETGQRFEGQFEAKWSEQFMLCG